jgi:putative transposase
MKTSKFTDEQIAMALRQAEAGTPVGEICRKLGVSEQTFYRWKKRFGALGVSELRELAQLASARSGRSRKEPWDVITDRPGGTTVFSSVGGAIGAGLPRSSAGPAPFGPGFGLDSRATHGERQGL